MTDTFKLKMNQLGGLRSKFSNDWEKRNLHIYEILEVSCRWFSHMTAWVAVFRYLKIATWWFSWPQFQLLLTNFIQFHGNFNLSSRDKSFIAIWNQNVKTYQCVCMSADRILRFIINVFIIVKEPYALSLY